mmetsp:Transcript_100600/g.177159  ORF Transcript_100600/g.177159 Transcript_100600/m.177159 type:complete len:477 (-) Transcript_100600:100-1530(-)
MSRLRHIFRQGAGAALFACGGGISPLSGLHHDAWTQRSHCSEVQPRRSRREVSPKEQAQLVAQMERVMQLAKAGAGEDLVGMLQEVEDQWWQRGRLHKIVLTGGPCAGKSTVMADLVRCLKEKNFLVFTMPEVATVMHGWSGGRMWDDFGEDGPMGDRSWAELQVMLTSVQMTMEDTIENMAKRSLAVRSKAPKPPRGAVIIFDRGVIDNKAYCTDEAWAIVLDELGTTTARLRDRRYEHVIHMVTAANGAQEFYTLNQADSEDGETARHKPPKKAIEMDQKIQTAWHGVQNLYVVGNHGSFEKKRQQVKDIVLQIVLGEDGPALEGVRKRYQCEFIPAYEIKRLAEDDPTIDWPVLIKTTLTYLSDVHCLQKFATPGEANIYYHQWRDGHGSILRAQQIDGWTYLQKARIAKDAGTGELQELHEERVMFTYMDSYFRCRCSGKDASLIVEVGVNPGETDKKPTFPVWLRPLGELP